MTQFLQYLESCKFRKVCRIRYISCNPLKNYKGGRSNHISQKKLKKIPKNDGNCQNSKFWNIKAYFGKTFSVD